MLNDDKTHAMVFSLRDMSGLQQGLEQVRLVGVQVDNKLTFEAHVNCEPC
jgi:hypothetical protein